MYKKYTLLSYLTALIKKSGLRSALGTLFGNYGVARTTMIRIPDARAIYMAIPKCANSSMKAMIAGIVHDAYPDIPYCEQWPPRMFNDEAVTELLRERNILIYHNELDAYKDHCIFCVVRNPWDRLLSAYAEKIIKYADRPLPGFFDIYGDRFSHGMSFEKFVEAVFSIPDTFANHHFSSQFHLVFCKKKQRLIPNRIIKIEHFPKAIDELLAEIGVTGCTFPHLLRSDRVHYRDMYSTYTRDLVRQRYASDIITFGYEF
jgi:hypothetical protein